MAEDKSIACGWSVPHQKGNVVQGQDLTTNKHAINS